MKYFLLVLLLCGCSTEEFNRGLGAAAAGGRPGYQSSQQQPMKQYDYTCMDRCRTSGYQYQFCQSKCSY